MRRKMTLHDKFCRNCSNFIITTITLTLCGFTNQFYIVNSSYNKEYWKFQNNSFKTLIKGSTRDNFYVVNYILNRDEYKNDIMILVYFIFYMSSILHNNTVYVNVPRCMRFLNYKINICELYDYIIHNLIFNFLITFPILFTIIRLMYSIMPYFPFYTFLSMTILLNTIEKIFKIITLGENKTSWNIFLRKTE